MSTGRLLDEAFNIPEYDEGNSILKEAPDDEEPSGGGETPAGNETDDANAENNAEDAEQDQTEENPEDQGEENQDNDDQQDNFDIDTDNTDEGEGEDQYADDQNNAGNAAGGSAGDEGDEDEASEEAQSQKDTYDQMYKELTPEEKAYRDMILRKQFRDLHTVCGNIIMKAGYFPNISQTQKELKRVIKALHTFRKYIRFYISEIYSTKSFYENKFQYEVYLQIFNGIKAIFDEFEFVMSHNETDSDETK